MLKRLLKPKKQVQPTKAQYSCNLCCDANLPLHERMIASKEEWQDSAATCTFCNLIFQAVGPFYDAFDGKDEEGLDVIAYRGLKGNFNVEIIKDVEDFTRVALEAFRDEKSSCPWPLFRPVAFASVTVVAAAARISQWIETCDAKHESCGGASTSETPDLPTRVVEILGPQQVRLHVSTGQQKAKYICLSHCWGGITTLRTTRTNYAEFQDEIPWDMVPATFKDAIDLTRFLGLKYIWIDSLCIIQDDIEDWRHEGSNMATIYSNSHITLAASASRNAHWGLYPRDPPSYHSFELRQTPDTEPFTIYVRMKVDHTLFLAGTLPLLRRAWFFQERLLSPRVVHFADRELYWECLHERKCECGDATVMDFEGAVLRKDVMRGGASKRHDVIAPTLNAKITSTVGHQWHRIVSQYTLLGLTFQTDILPALQGVAKHMQRTRNCDYYAGLWEDNLLSDLLWWSERFGERANTYRAPTWSWASTLGWIEWWDSTSGRMQEHATIVSIDTMPAGDDPMGEVTNGNLAIRGRCVRAILHYSGESTYYRPGNCVTLDLEPKASSNTDTLSISSPEWHPDVLADLDSDLEVLLMEIGSDRWDDGRYYLGFQRVADGREVYERVGCARTGVLEIHEAFRESAEEMTITVQ